jgi:hypothetical protein
VEAKPHFVASLASQKRSVNSVNVITVQCVGKHASAWRVAHPLPLILYPVPVLRVPRPCVFCKGGYDAAGTMRCYACRVTPHLRLHHLHFILLGEPGIVRVNVGWGEFSFRNRVA